MCLLVLYYQMNPAAHILLAAQREEMFERASLPPAIHSGATPVLCGVDVLAGGTWLGVGAYGVLVAVTNRHDTPLPIDAKSRGTLCRQLLEATSAQQAADAAIAALDSGRYAGANLLCADGVSAHVVSHAVQTTAYTLSPGRHLLGNRDLNDASDIRLRHAAGSLPLQADSPVAAMLDRLAGQMSQPPQPDSRASMVVRAADRGTVSSTLCSVGEKPANQIYRYAPGPPDRTPYQDYSLLLQQVLAR